MELKEYLRRFLISKGYCVVNEDGFLLGIPSKDAVSVLITAHMDTVHKETVKEVYKTPHLNTMNEFEIRISSPQGIGGDDRCGVFMIMNILDTVKPYVLFCEDEERGGIGSGKFVDTKHVDKVKYVNYIIELDRAHSNDAVYYSCDNKEFTKWIEKETGYKEAIGSFSDVSTLMPKLNVAGVNFSCGYYNAHTTNEYVVEDEMLATMEMVKQLLQKESKRYEYVKKQYAIPTFYSSSNTSYYKKKSKAKRRSVYDTKVTLYVEIDDGFTGSETYTEIGDTKPECWMNMFMNNSTLCFDDILNYWYE